MLALIVGDCPSCILEGHRILRMAGLVRDSDYYEANRFDFRNDKLFEKRAELYTMTTAILYDRDSGQFINLKISPIDERVLADIRLLAKKDPLK